MPILSVVFPILNEINNSLFWQSLESLLQFKNIEVIVVDGGSDDGTLEQLKVMGITPISSATDRATRLNKGVEESHGDLILLHHPRSLVSNAGILDLLKNKPKTWGGFTHSFDWSHPLLRFTSWYSNHGRRNLWKVLYLDHCLFFPRDVVNEVFPLPPVEIFEDTLLSYRLRKNSANQYFSNKKLQLLQYALKKEDLFAKLSLIR